jgi:selenocysteine-specific elongation factor
VILGTAGHVDHGKTALVRALTGIDTDRLPEEKRRGITLELGFAHLDLPDGTRLGVIDVPGHERFVKAMAGGAGGVDLALLVVAADEGVMPQTREHVDICTLLGVRRGLVVITKADLLPALGDGWLELLSEELRAALAGSVFEGAPFIPVSAKTGEGLPALREAIAHAAGELSLAREPRAERTLFVPVDRAFTVKGFGVVATGTVWSGRLTLDDELALLPGAIQGLRVRGLQQHGVAVEQALAGERVAINLAQVDLAQVHRGQALTASRLLPEARALDVELTLLPSVGHALPRRSRQLLTLGTAQVEALVVLTGTSALAPGERAFAQLRLGAPVAALPGLRFVLRGPRAMAGRGATIAGGVVLGLNPPRRRKAPADVLAPLATGSLDERVRFLLGEAGPAGLLEAELSARAVDGPKQLARALAQAGAQGQAVLVDREARRYLAGAVLERLAARATAAVEAFFAGAPEATSMSRESLRQRLGVPHERTFQRLLQLLGERRALEVQGDAVRLPGRQRAPDAARASGLDTLRASLARAGLTPLSPEDLAHREGLPPARALELLQALVKEGAAVRAGDLFFHRPAVAALEEKLRAFLAGTPTITTLEFKALTGVSRKFAIPLAEYFDRERVTLRVGDVRRLLGAPS